MKADDFRAVAKILRAAGDAGGAVKKTVVEAGREVIERAPHKTGAHGIHAVADAIDVAGSAVGQVQETAAVSTMQFLMESAMAVTEAGHDPAQLAADASGALLTAQSTVTKMLKSAMRGKKKSARKKKSK